MVLELSAAAELLGHVGDPVLLGVRSEGPVFAADLSGLSEPEAVGVAGAESVVDVRGLFAGLSEADAALFACARGFPHWHRNQRFCAAGPSGSRTRVGGTRSAATSCGRGCGNGQPARRACDSHSNAGTMRGNGGRLFSTPTSSQ